MKYIFQIIFAASLFIATSSAIADGNALRALPVHSNLSEVNSYVIKSSDESKGIIIVSAKKIAKLGTWTIEFTTPRREERLENVDPSLAKSAMIIGLERILQNVPANEIRVVRIDLQVSQNLWNEFQSAMRNTFAELEGLVEPKSKDIFVRFKQFLDQSLFVQETSKAFSKRLNSNVINVLPGEEINFEQKALGMKWQQLSRKSNLYFYLPVTFCIIFDTKME